MLMTSSGLSPKLMSRAEMGKESIDAVDGKLGEDYRLVTVHVTEGKFQYPQKYVTGFSESAGTPDVSTPSKAARSVATPSGAVPGVSTPSGATPGVATPNTPSGGDETVNGLIASDDKQTTTFYVENDVLTLDELEEAMRAAELTPPETIAKETMWNQIVWLSKKGTLDSAISQQELMKGGYPLSQTTTNLYVEWNTDVDVKSSQLADTDPPICLGSDGKPVDGKLTVSDLEPERQITTETKMKDVAAQTETLKNVVSIDVKNILQLDISLTGSTVKNGKITIRMELPQGFTNGLGNRKIIVLHQGKNGWEGFKEGDGLKKVKKQGKVSIEFALSDFSPVIIASAQFQEQGQSTSVPTSYGGGDDYSGSSSTTGTDYRLYGTWKKDAKGWRFKPNGGSEPKNRWGSIKNSWYYFGEDGYMKTGWLQWKNAWYYLNPANGDDEGKMMTGWVYDKNYGTWFYLGKTGMMETGWRQINDVWYYLNPSSDGTKGAMASNQWIGDYFVDSLGAWKQDAKK